VVPPRVDAPRYRRRVHHIDWSSPPAWIGLLIASGSLWVAFQARSHARESAKAAKRTVKLAELVEQRKRHGWALELRDGNEASSSVTPGRWTLTTWTSRPVNR